MTRAAICSIIAKQVPGGQRIGLEAARPILILHTFVITLPRQTARFA
jgi:hypothetical protein